MFVDTAKVTVIAGRGGDGVVSFRHEIYVDRGGPDGGDGGRGGDVIFVATENLNTLVDFRYKPILKAKVGGSGAKRNMHGKSGDDLIVKVPVGTVVTRDGEVIADLDSDGKEVVVARGGGGGFGNAHFKSSTRQAPRIAELGEPGESFEADLELKLLADVGLVGFPNAGKSTFLSVVTNAKPEIADYAFTTLSPNLGVADIDGESLLIADIPGLIEGASDGKGLGDSFLRHVERTAVLLHLIDIYEEDLAGRYQAIRHELASFDQSLSERPEVIALTKIDGMSDEQITDRLNELRAVVPEETSLFAISSQAHKNTTTLLRTLIIVVKAERQKNVVALNSDNEPTDDLPVITLGERPEDDWSVSTNGGIFVVTGRKIERFATRTNFDQYDAVNRLRDIMKKMGITAELIRQGAESASVISIANHHFTLIEQ